MTTLTIKIPDSEVQEVSSFIKQKGGTVVKKASAAEIKSSQHASFEKGLKEAILISRGDIEGTRYPNFGMNSILFTDEFKRKVKPLAKKYHTLKDSIDSLGAELIENPFLGESYGSNIYKIRLADKSKGKGKSGGFRILYYLAFQKEENINILLITIFDKSEIDTIKKNDAELLLEKVLSELKKKK